MFEFKSTQSFPTQDQPALESFLTLQNQLESLSLQDITPKPNLPASKNKKLKIKFKQFNQSNWTLKENLSYKNFLKQHYLLFETEKKFHRSIKINVLMSQVVKTRSSDQCRSHHQKMMRRHKNIPQIISYFENFASYFEKKQDKHSVQPNSQDQKQKPEQIHDVASASIFKEILAIQQYLRDYHQDNIWWDGQQL